MVAIVHELVNVASCLARRYLYRYLLPSIQTSDLLESRSVGSPSYRYTAVRAWTTP